MKNKISIITLIFLVLGIIGGLVFPGFMNDISFLGTIYVNLLKFIVIPILLTNMIVTLYNTKVFKSKVLIKSIVIFLIMFVTTFLITSLVIWLINPGIGYNFSEIEWTNQVTEFNLSNIIVNLFPSNISTMVSSNSIFASIIFAFVFAYSSLKAKNGDKVIEVIDGLKNIFNKIFEIIMYLTPLGVFSLIGLTIANYGKSLLSMGATYIGMAYLCSIIALILVMILPAWIIGKINPLTYIKRMSKIWIITLTTCSSAATLPVTIKVCNDEFKIPSKVTDVVVPLGCTIHMCGGAVSFALLGIFCCQLYGIEISLLTYLLMLTSATLINMAAPGIPGGGIVIGATYLSLLGIPLTFIGFYSGIYKILDMSYTTLNVTGDVTANIIINKIKE